MANPLRSNTVKGALVHFEDSSSQGRTLVFRYNPSTLQRAMSGASTAGGAFEQIRFTLSLDATDDLERGDPGSKQAQFGIYPDLCAIESFLQPPNGAARSRLGSWFGASASARPFTVFVWGRNRIAPVRLTGATIREEMFDASLNPIRAEVDLTLEVVREGDYPASSAAARLLDAFTKRKMQLAQLAYAPGTLEDLTKAMGGNDG